MPISSCAKVGKLPLLHAALYQACEASVSTALVTETHTPECHCWYTDMTLYTDKKPTMTSKVSLRSVEEVAIPSSQQLLPAHLEALSMSWTNTRTPSCFAPQQEYLNFIVLCDLSHHSNLSPPPQACQYPSP